MNWPNFYCVGAPKAGTTSLYYHLKEHPQIFLPKIKEPDYFRMERTTSISLEKYKSLYQEASGYPAVGDMTTIYLMDEEVPARIREVSPGAKIIVMLRDPVERAFSDYTYHRQAGHEHLESFREALRRYEDRQSKDWWLSEHYVKGGMYYGQVRRYLETFGNDQVLVLLFDDLVRSPNELLSRIARHIGVDPDFFTGLDCSEVHNQYRMPKIGAIRWLKQLGAPKLLPHSIKLRLRLLFFDFTKPSLEDDLRRLLQEIHDPDVTRLEELLGRKIPELRKSWI